MTSDRPPPFFVADHLALDFLNTLATPQGAPIDWLRDGNDLIDWLKQAGTIERTDTANIREWDRDAVDEIARQAREFRQWLRAFVVARMGKPVRATAAALAPLNELLAAENSFQKVEAVGRGAGDRNGLLLRRGNRWREPRELLVPIAAAAADLICNRDFRLIRSCEGSGCVLLFLDQTKARVRRWCSMAVCGNRAKAAAHRARKARPG
ncbi:MAG TPA: ABATE domain-containing protein [Pirellulales bacterium]|nr:ABATE domain-containing protein [Pirellulales bacterium]